MVFPLLVQRDLEYKRNPQSRLLQLPTLATGHSAESSESRAIPRTHMLKGRFLTSRETYPVQITLFARYVVHLGQPLVLAHGMVGMGWAWPVRPRIVPAVKSLLR